MKLTTFNGGLNVRVDPHLIQDNQGVIYKNIDDSKGTLTPVKDKKLELENAKRFGVWFEAEQRWIFSSKQISWAEFQEILYYANGITRPQKVIGETTYNLGIDPPSTLNVLIPEAPSNGIDVNNIVFGDLQDYCLEKIPGEPSFCTSFGTLRQGQTYTYKFVTKTEDGNVKSEDVTHTLSEYVGPNISQLTGAITINIEDPNFGNGVDVYRLYGGKYRLVGTVSEEGIVLVDNRLDISANESLTDSTDEEVNLNGTYQYALTYYSAIDGSESQPYLSEEAIIEGSAAQLVNIDISNDGQVTEKRLYRIGGNLTDFGLVAKLDPGVTEYLDNTPDSKIEGSILTSYDNAPPKQTLKYLVEAYGMLFGAVQDRLYFTPIGKPNAWPEAFYLDFPTPITGIGEVPIGLIICTRTKTYLVTGTGPNSLAQQLLDGSEGCINHYTMCNLEGAATWVSSNGICVSNGGGIVNATKTKMDRLVLDPVNAVVFDKSYYVQLTDGSIFTMDADAQTLKYFELGTDSLFVGNNKLLGHNNSALHELFAGSAYIDMHFKSAEFAVGGLTQQKLYKNVYANLDGKVEIKAYLNGELVQTLDYDATDIVQFKFPQYESKGYKLQFEVTGPGRLLELSWEDKSANA